MGRKRRKPQTPYNKLLDATFPRYPIKREPKHTSKQWGNALFLFILAYPFMYILYLITLTIT